MKIWKVLPLVALFGLVACSGTKSAPGVVGGLNKRTAFNEASPAGMVRIPSGSFLMGPNSQSSLFTQHDNNLMVTVNAFWMDQTEITNHTYRTFVDWVRDSIAYRMLIGDDGFESEYAMHTKGYEDEDAPVVINWKKRIPWEKRNIPDDPVSEALRGMFHDNGYGTLNTTLLRYNYSFISLNQAKKKENTFDVSRGVYPAGAKAQVDSFWVEADGSIHDTTVTRNIHSPKDLMTNVMICVYPDTMVWMRDFEFAYNDPMVTAYFSFPGFSEYPVVGVTWEQAQAFCNWRTHYYSQYNREMINNFRLPSEAEWEYAARGGRNMAMYPWGDRYARDNSGCFLANFKPYRGGYSDDSGTMTMAVASFYPNDFGLYDMAGNVAEWTSSAYSTAQNVYVHDVNPDRQYNALSSDPDILKRKVVKGGSWKDISYYLQCGVRSYEYQFESHSYLGFRCVRSVVGENIGN